MSEVRVIEVTDQVPADLAAIVGASEVPVVVRLVDPDHLAGDALAGWQIGAATAALLAGASDVQGIDARRLARVRSVVGRLEPVEAGDGPR